MCNGASRIAGYKVTNCDVGLHSQVTLCGSALLSRTKTWSYAWFAAVFSACINDRTLFADRSFNVHVLFLYRFTYCDCVIAK